MFSGFACRKEIFFLTFLKQENPLWMNGEKQRISKAFFRSFEIFNRLTQPGNDETFDDWISDIFPQTLFVMSACLASEPCSWFPQKTLLYSSLA